jgi:splicing factor 3B subunit 2
MGLSAAERNKRKRERKKREREEKRKQEEEATKDDDTTSSKDASQTTAADDVEIEYVTEPILSEEVEGLRRFRDLVPSVDTTSGGLESSSHKTSSVLAQDEDDDESYDRTTAMSKRKLREKLRPSVADLKRRVARPELVEAHDVTAADPEFLIELKSVPGTVPVPRNWGRKRKYLQGKVRIY